MSGTGEGGYEGMDGVSRYSAEGSLAKLQAEYGVVDEGLDSSPLAAKGSLDLLREEYPDVDRELQKAWLDGLEEKAGKVAEIGTNEEIPAEVRSILETIKIEYTISNPDTVIKTYQDILDSGTASPEAQQAIRIFFEGLDIERKG